MKTFKEYIYETGRCWTGYKPVKNKKAYSKGSCEKEETEVVQEDGMGAGAVASAGPTNTVGSGAIAGSGGKGGEPGVDLRKRKKDFSKSNPVMMGMMNRKLTKI